MQDEEMDDMIRDASSQHHPTYDDKAWGKMEQLLDKELPLKKDKRRYGLFLLLFVLLGTGAFFAIFNSAKKNNQPAIEAAASQNKIDNSSSNNSYSIKNDVEQNNKTTTVINKETNINSNRTIQPNTTNQITAGIAIADIDKSISNKSKSHQTNKISFSKKYKIKSNSTSADINDDAANTASNNNKQNAINQNEISTEAADEKIINGKTSKANNDIAVKDSSKKIIENINKPIDTTKQPPLAKSTTAKKETTSKFKNNFAFTISAGAGFSYVGLDYLGKTTVAYGAGVSYALSKKFSVRTGFYVSSKIYSANGSDYHPPKSFAVYYHNLQKVDANCKVYEIPLNVTYSFSPHKKHNWFVATGLASYLMKKEAYGYYYEGTNGQPAFRSSTIENQNQHWFSILTLSGGYQYKINNRLSIMAEPYIEMPLSGIGFGKINLNSSGLMFTAVIKPFVAKK